MCLRKKMHKIQGTSVVILKANVQKSEKSAATEGKSSYDCVDCARMEAIQKENVFFYGSILMDGQKPLSAKEFPIK